MRAGWCATPRRPRGELRTTTQQAVEAKTREAEDAARTRAKEIVGEARGLRQGVLTDLEERRKELERQIGDLRAGRGKLVETYELVDRALGHTARVMAEEPSTPPRGPRRAQRRGKRTSSCIRRPPTAAVPIPPVSETAPEPEQAVEEAVEAVEPSARGVGNVRRGRHRRRCAVREVAFRTPRHRSRGWSDEAPGEPASSDTGDDPASEGVVAGRRRRRGRERTSRKPCRRRPRDGRQGRRARRDRRGSRAAGQARGAGRAERRPRRPAPPAGEDRRRQGATRRRTSSSPGGRTCSSRPSTPPTRRAPPPSAGAGRLAAVPRALLTELATTVVTPLRDRLDSSLESIDAKSPADIEIAIAQRLGARYREWRGQDLEDVLGDVLAAAYARGAYDAAPEGRGCAGWPRSWASAPTATTTRSSRP